MTTEDLKRVDELINAAIDCTRLADESDDYDEIETARKECGSRCLLAIAMMLRDQVRIDKGAPIPMGRIEVVDAAGAAHAFIGDCGIGSKVMLDSSGHASIKTGEPSLNEKYPYGSKP